MAFAEGVGAGVGVGADPDGPPATPPPKLRPRDKDALDDSDSLSSSSEEEEENVLEEKATVAENKILANPYIYTDHVDLIAILHRLANLSRLRTAYERLSKICPMAPSQWLHWLQLETKNASNPEDRKQLHKLFHKAFIDCYSIHIYTEWSAMSLSNGEGETDARTVLQQALRLAGSDPVDGAMLWDTAREFELALLYVMDTQSEDYSSQVMRIFDIFNKQLSRPLLQSEKTVEEFRTFAEIMDVYIPNSEDLIKQVEENHVISERVLKELLEFENELEGTNENETKVIAEKYDTYVNYISRVKSLIDDKSLECCDIANLLGVLYDRITSECFAPFCRAESSLPVNAENMCNEYIEHAREYGDDDYCLNVIEKVSRRCPRKSSLSVLKLRQLERMGKGFEEIKSEFETALFSGFDTANDYVALWLCYLEILKRKTNFSLPEQIEILRKTFRLAWDSLSEMWGDEADKDCTILQYLARLEYQLTKDYKYGENIFQEIMSYGDNKLRGSLWLEYIQMERLRGGDESARNIFRKAVRSSPDPRLQKAWLSLERDFGTLDTLTECVRICADKSKEWEETKSKKSETNYKAKNKSFKSANSFSKGKSGKKNKEFDTKTEKSMKKSQNIIENERKDYSFKKPGFNSSKNNGIDRFQDQNDNEYLKKPAKQIKRTINEPKDYNSVPPKKVKIDEKPKAEPMDVQSDFEASEKHARREFENTEEKNDRTIFISNLDFKTTEDVLKTKLSEYGVVEELRLVTAVKTFGTICYCVYRDPKSVDVAVSHDRTLLEDRPMFISRYCPTKDSRKKHFTYSTNIEKNKLFVKNIPFEDCTDEKLRSIFGKFGDLKDIRIVTYKTGKPKGIAYVEYKDDKSAVAAITGVDGTELRGRVLGVVLSAPPPRRPELPELSSNTSLRPHARTKLFVPTVLQKASTSVSNTDQASSSSTSNRLSNTDFRNILLGKK